MNFTLRDMKMINKLQCQVITHPFSYQFMLKELRSTTQVNVVRKDEKSTILAKKIIIP